ncbi:YdcF family protein [Nibribacter ruber]|uniref:YdcF family protein n=1 Tax=Nibribacter ruber TaxID=2698458 RepID=A0A6P1NWV9_9BACT|nr:YdcF family protein [Nibribacter ruber]QHL86804.1 YdcF family protein [Nibribacter ruber]
MFFILSKLLQYLTSPFLWIMAVFVFGLFSRNQGKKRWAFRVGLVLLFFFSNPFISNEVWLAWEPEAVLMKDVKNYDAAIVLTGVTEVNRSPHDRVHFNEGAERILDAVQLYKMGRVQKIIITGGSGAIKDVVRTEAENLEQTALYAGVPKQDILIEQRSRNTRENALYTKELLSQHPELQRLLLITSAFHMRRAQACFEKVGLNFDTFPADFQTHDRSFHLDDLLIPSAEALQDWTRLLHEWVGVLTYKLLGYS